MKCIREVSSGVKDFSLFEQALRVTGTPQTDLGTISSISRRAFVERESLTFRAKVPCFEYGCLLIENAIMLGTNRAGRIYAGFEKLSCMQPVLDRYLRIGDVSDCVYVFGEPDWEPPRHPNMRLVKLTSDFKLAHECFLIANSPTLQIALVAIDEEGFAAPVLEERHFQALKTSNVAVIRRLVSDLEEVIDWSVGA
jgi:hypothetical protein